jgi:hypothetical protein
LAAEVEHRIVGTPTIDNHVLQSVDELQDESRNKCKGPAGVLTYKGRIYEPKDNLLPNKVIHLVDDNPESSHFGARKTAE